MIRKGTIDNLFNRLANRWSNNSQTRGRLLRRAPALVVAPAVALAALLAMAGWTLTNSAANATAGASVTSFIGIKLIFDIGKRNTGVPCAPGFGVCRITLSTSSATRPNTAVVSATPLDEKRMECLFEANPPSRDRLLIIAEDKLLDEAIARKLGFKSVTILRGDYAFESGKGKFGGVILNMKAAK